MKNVKYIWFADILFQKNNLKYKNINNNLKTVQRFDSHNYNFRLECEKAIGLKPEFNRIREKNYEAALDFWDLNFPGATRYFFYPDMVLSPQDILSKYPDYYVSSLPEEKDGQPNPEENKIYLKWYMKKYLSSHSQYNIEIQKNNVEESLVKSNNKIGYLEKELNETINTIDFEYLGKPAQNGRVLNWEFLKWNKIIFEELDFKGQEPDFGIIGTTRAEIYVKAKFLIEYREFVKLKLEEIKSGKINLLVEDDELEDKPGEWNLRQRYLLLIETDKKIKLLFDGNSINQKSKTKLISILLNCNLRTARELLNQTRSYKITGDDISKIETLKSSINLE